MGSPKETIPKHTASLSPSTSCLPDLLSRCPQCLSASKAVPKTQGCTGLVPIRLQKIISAWLSLLVRMWNTSPVLGLAKQKKMAWLQLSLASFDLADYDGHELELLQGRPLKPPPSSLSVSKVPCLSLPF